MDSALIEAAIGLVLVYLVFSLSVTSLNEAIASLLQLRGRVLYQRLQEIFAGEADFILNDPLLRSLSANGRPSYIPPALFGEAVAIRLRDYLDRVRELRKAVATEAAQAQAMKEAAAQSLAELPAPIQDYAESLLERVGETASDIRGEIERLATRHFDEIASRLSGVYARRIKLFSAVISAVLVIGANVDSLRIVNLLLADASLRRLLVDRAEGLGESSGTPDELAAGLDDALLSSLPIGWDCAPAIAFSGIPDLACGFRPDALAVSLLGWSISALAIMLGAPFWFGTLQRISNIRGSGGKPEGPPSK